MATTLVTPERPSLSVDWHVASQRWRLAVLAALITLVSVFYTWFVLLSPVLSPLTMLVWILCAAIVWRPLVGLCFAFGFVHLFEPGGADQMMLPGRFMYSSVQSTLGTRGIIITPLEVLLLLTFGVWLAQGIARRRIDFRTGHLFWPVVLFSLSMIFGLIRGQLTGGDLNVAFWESRALFYTIICYFVAANTVRTRGQVKLLTAITLVTTGLFALEGVYRRLALINTGLLGVIPEFAWAHDTVIFLATVLLVIVLQQVFGAPLWQRIFGLAVFPVAGFTLLAMERRAGSVAFMAAFLALSLVFLIAHRKAFFFLAIPVLVGGAVYLPLFWNNTGMLGQPARAIRSLSEPDARDHASNLTRELEKINVRATIRSNPVLGVGFGRQYSFVVPLPDMSWWPFFHYEPHHNIMWVWLKTGVLGFIFFWTLVGAALARAAHFAKTLRAAELRVFALLSLVGIICVLVFSYVDLGLVSPRVTVFLGIALGTLAVLDRIEETD